MIGTLSDQEIELLRKLINGEGVELSSNQRLRLELLGVIKDGARGVVATELARYRLRQLPRATAEEPAPVRHPHSPSGKRRPNRRRVIE